MALAADPMLQAIGFEGGMGVMLVPFFAWWLDVSLWQAFVLDLELLLFFLGYTFVFNWTFDRIFGLPASALPVGETFEVIKPKIQHLM